MNAWREARRLVRAGLRRLRRSPPGTHQDKGTTSYDRYPEIFRRARELLSRAADPRVLSFGCSTGEECATLRGYLPRASIVGVDIRPRAIATARRRHGSPVLSFHLATPENIRRHGPYDAIFALSVLCVWPDSEGLPDIGYLYTFDAFDAALRLLDANLKPGGLLVVYNASFFFEDARIAVRYEPMASSEVPPGFVHRFERDHRRSERAQGAVFFRKICDETPPAP